MDSENANAWHNHMYESCIVVAKKLFNVQSIFNNCNLVARYNHNATPQEVKRN